MRDKTEKAPKVSIIILNRNQKDYTVECLNSLLHLDYPNYHLIVIDNASSDRSCEIIEKQFPAVTLIKSEENLGVTGGRNLGIECVLSQSIDYILFLDNDTTVHKDMIKHLVSRAEREDRVAIVTPRIYFYSDPDRIWSIGGWINFYKGLIYMYGYGEMDHGQYDSHSSIEVDHVPGCCLMIKREALEEIGRFDARFYSGQDTELCVRAKRHGYKVLAIPQAVMWHRDTHSWARDGIHYMRGKSIFLLMRKHAKFYHWIGFSLYAFFTIVKVLFREGIRGNFKNILEKIKGAFEGMQT